MDINVLHPNLIGIGITTHWFVLKFDYPRKVGKNLTSKVDSTQAGLNLVAILVIVVLWAFEGFVCGKT